MSTPSEHVVDLLDDYVHGLLSPQEQDRVDGHCARCPACARGLEQARRRRLLLESVPPTEPPARLVQTTLSRVERERQIRRKRRARIGWGVLGAFAASVLLLLGASVYYTRLQPSTFDMVVFGQTRLLAATTASLRIRLLDRATGRPVLAGVPVAVALHAPDGRKQELARFETDELGAGNPRFELPDWADGSYQLRITAATHKGEEVLTRAVQLTRSWRLMLSSDKPVYKPGQTILVRALALRKPDLKPVARQRAVFTLTDPKGNVLFKHTADTSAFGISSAECALAQEIQEGSYTLACRIGDTESKQTVEIRQYVLPKFKIDLHPDRPYYSPGETAKLAVQGDYFFGKPVADAAVEVEVRTRDVGERVVGRLTGKTDATGGAKLTFSVPRSLVGRETDGGDARLRFVATVTDGANQKQTRAVERTVTTRPVRIEVIPEAGNLVRGVPNTVYLLVTRADGSPVPGATVDAAGDDVRTQARADERGAASFQLTPTGTQVSMTLRASAPGGVVLARKHAVLACGQSTSDFLLRTDRAVYQAGKTISLRAMGAGVEPVFVDFIKDGQTLLSETVEVIDGKGEYQFDLPADVFGAIQLVAYRFTPSGLPLRKVRVLYVEPAEGLKISAALDRGEYRPGRSAKLNLALTDSKGKPTPGAISLAAVDEAVFSVLAQRPGMEQTFFNLEQDLLKPVYAIYPWMPGEDRGASQRDQALFATTARGIGTLPPPEAAPPGAAPGGAAVASAIQPVGPHSLAANSFPEKEKQVQELKKKRLGLVRMGWVGLVLAALASGYACLWTFLPAGDVLKIHAIAGAVLGGLGIVGLALVAVSPQVMPTSGFAGAKVARESAPQFGGLARGLPNDLTGAMAPGMVATKEDRWRPEAPPNAAAPGAPAPRVRNFFPETLLWKPELITDDQGRLQPLEVTLADSITTWRLGASAVSSDGRMGAVQLPLKVFQPFFVDLNLPVSLTRGDEVGVPVVVYNYLPRPQTVTLTIKKSDWFSLSGDETMRLDLAANEIRSTRFTLTVKRVGTHKLRVTALAGEVSDAIEREIDVIPDGRRVETSHSGTLELPETVNLDVPAAAIEGSVKAFVKLYPSSFSQVVEGLDNIFRMPFGCFEQTSSTTYPNVLALSYLRRTKQSAPRVEAKARQYIHLGYQRLVGFEVPGGGFDWFGRAPANRMLTAYGLMEFEDMAAVHDVDPNLITRTRNWLLSQRKPDGSWDPEGHALHENVVRADAENARLAATAYVAWAVFANGKAKEQSRQTLDYLLARSPNEVKDPHVLALVCNALLALDPQGDQAGAWLDRLAALRKRDEGGKFSWWEKDAAARTMFFGGGVSAQVETTALAAAALIQGKRHPEASRGALAWLVSKKDANGTWHSTQATVLSLRALLAGTSQPLAGDGARRFEVRVGDHVEQVAVPADQAEVMKLLDVSKHLKEGANKVQLTEKSKTAAGYQVVFRYHLMEAKKPRKKEPLSIALDYDRTELALGDVVKAKARVVNETPTTAPMVMLDLPVPPGFDAAAEAFAALVKAGKIARYQVRARSVLVYLRGLEPNAPLELAYTLRATMPVKAAAAGARVYEYYDPQKQGSSPATRFTVTEK
jgi:uncharacterized protein YfaS (alpha-2-macroglobulin family)